MCWFDNLQKSNDYLYRRIFVTLLLHKYILLLCYHITKDNCVTRIIQLTAFTFHKFCVFTILGQVYKCNRPSLTNGRVTPYKFGGYNANENVYFTCNQGFLINGGSTARCIGGSYWSATPTCQCKSNNKKEVDFNLQYFIDSTALNPQYPTTTGPYYPYTTSTTEGYYPDGYFPSDPHIPNEGGFTGDSHFPHAEGFPDPHSPVNGFYTNDPYAPTTTQGYSQGGFYPDNGFSSTPHFYSSVYPTTTVASTATTYGYPGNLLYIFYMILTIL